jgi:hypothetical protein
MGFFSIRSSYTIFGLRRKATISINFADTFITLTASLSNLILNIALRVRAAINLFFLFSVNVFVVIVLVGAVMF